LIHVRERSSRHVDLDGMPPNGAGTTPSERVLSPGHPLYRVTINAHLGKSKWQALVDRGANGGIVGNDSKVLARTGKYVNLCGVDDHKVDDSELVTAGAVVETQKGPIIIIMNQCARMANGKTIHSSGQMEHHKVVVKDQAHAITNVVP
jgi:hypothetical protein